MNYGFWKFNNTCGLFGSESTTETLPDGRVVTHKNADYPAVIESTFIVNALRTSRQARADFNRLFPTLDTESQERLTALLSRHRFACELMLDTQANSDQIQAHQTTSGIRTRLPKR